MTPKKALILGPIAGIVGFLIVCWISSIVALAARNEPATPSEIWGFIITMTGFSCLFGIGVGRALVNDRLVKIKPGNLIWQNGRVTIAVTESTAVKFWRKDPLVQGKILSFGPQNEEIIIVGPHIQLTGTTGYALRYKVNIEKGGTVESFSQFKTWEEKIQQSAQQLIACALYAADRQDTERLTTFQNPADNTQQAEFNRRIQEIVNPLIERKGVILIETSFYFV